MVLAFGPQMQDGALLNTTGSLGTGTPPGVAFGMKPAQVWLKAGDVVELGIDGLGTQTQKVVPFKA